VRAERILTTAALTYVHVCYVGFLFFFFVHFWGRHSEKILSAIFPYVVVAFFLTMVLMLWFVVNKRSDLRIAMWKRIMLSSAIMLTLTLFFMPMISRVREYAG
jgi:hypothetical protein